MTNSTHSRGRMVGLATVAALTACSLVATLVTPTDAQAQRRATPRLQMTYPTDGSLTCEQLTAEIGRMEEISGISAQNAQNAQSQGALADGAASVAVNAALYSGALSSVPGLGMFANMAGAGARRAAEARARAEAETVAVAEQRRTLLSGIYQGRQCGLAVATPVVAVAPVPDAAVTTPIDPAPAAAAPAMVEPATAAPEPATSASPAPVAERSRS